MYNKKVLSDSIKSLASRKAPAKKKDKVVNNKLLPFISSEGYKQGPPPVGTNYRIPGNTIYNPTPYNINAVGSNGEQKFIAAGDTRNHTFDGAEYVDEYQAQYGGDISIPDLNQYEDGGEYDLTDDQIAELKKGGYVVEELPKKKNSKRYSRSLLATNPLFVKNPLLKKAKSKKRKIFDPNAKYYQDGGAKLPEDYNQFQNFAQTLPSNLQDPGYQYGNPDQYDLYGMWETVGKPQSFQDVQDSDYFPLQDDGTYSGFTVGSDGQFLKPMGHGTTWKEVMNAHLNTNPYFQQNRIIKNEQGRLQYVPNKQKGGPKEQYYTYAGSKNKYKKVGNQWYISNEGTAFDFVPIKDPTGSRTKELNKHAKIDPYPWIPSKSFERKINTALGDPMGASGRAGEYYAPEDEDDVDNIRHTYSGYRTAKGIADATGNIPYVSNPLGYIGSSILGAAHEVGTMFSDPRSWGTVLSEAAEDQANNIKGASMVFNQQSPAKTVKNIAQMSRQGLLPDGYGPGTWGPDYIDPYDLRQQQKTFKESTGKPTPVSLTEKFDKGGFQDDLNKRRKLLRDWTYGQSIGMLQKAQKGKFKFKRLSPEEIDEARVNEFLNPAKEKKSKFKRLSKEEEDAARFNQEAAMQAKAMPAQAPVETTVPEQSFDYWAGGPGIYSTEKDLPEIRLSPNTADLPIGHWLRYKREFQKTNPYSDFASERRKKYLRRTNQALNKLAGVSEKNFPERAERRIKAAYDEKMNTYIFERMGQDLGFNPKDRTTWVDQVTDPRVANTPEMRKVYEIIANSKYGSKLDPSVWSKFLSGVQQTANILLPKEIEINKKIPGYTEKENYEAQTSWSEPLNIFEPSYLLGNYFANLAYGTKEIAGTEGRTRPDLLSGQLNPEVSPFVPLITDPTLPFQLVSNPARFIGKNVVQGVKTTGKAIQKSRLAQETAKGYQNIIKPAFDATVDILETPVGKGMLSQAYQKHILKLPEWEMAFKAAQPATGIQAAITPASLLRSQTVGSGIANIPTFGRSIKRDYNIIMDDNTTFSEKSSAMRDMSRNVIMEGIQLSPLVGRQGLKLYQSSPASAAFLLDNLSKIGRRDPESLRGFFNLARVVTGRKTGGQVYEIDDKTRRILAKLGYQVEDVD